MGFIGKVGKGIKSRIASTLFIVIKKHNNLYADRFSRIKCIFEYDNRQKATKSNRNHT